MVHPQAKMVHKLLWGGCTRRFLVHPWPSVVQNSRRAGLGRRLGKAPLEPGDLPLAAAVAAGADEVASAVEVAAGGGEIAGREMEASPLQVGVALVEAHRAALGDLQGLAEVRGGAGEVGGQAPEGGAGQEAAGEIVLLARLPQAVHRPVEVVRGRAEVRLRGGRRQGQAEVGAAQGEVVEGDVEKGCL